MVHITRRLRSQTKARHTHLWAVLTGRPIFLCSQFDKRHRGDASANGLAVVMLAGHCDKFEGPDDC